jgi:hypothetical protein
MVKQVQKDFFYEIAAKFSEIFEDDSTEKAVKKAHLQNTPGKDAKITITDQRFTKSNIKVVGEEQYGGNRTKSDQGSTSQGKESGRVDV